jgi:hypothetical protein
MGFMIATGSMGDGKSYFAAEYMRKAIREGAIVHTNLDLRLEAWHCEVESDDQIVQLPEDDFKAWTALVRPGIEGRENVVIIDEGALLFNAQDWNKQRDEKKEVFKFMVYSRHLGLDVLFLTQSAKNVDAQVRRMCTEIVQCVKAERVKPYGPLFKLLYGDFRRHYLNGPGNQVLDSKWVRFDPEIGNLYYTHARAKCVTDTPRDIRRREKEDTTKISMKRKGLVMAGALAACVCAVLWAGNAAASMALGPDKKKKGEQASPPVAKPEVITRVETPSIPAPPTPTEPEVKKATYKPRGVTGRDFRGRKFVSLDGQTCYLGSVHNDKMIIAFHEKGEIITIEYEDGTKQKTRPSTRQDLLAIHQQGAAASAPPPGGKTPVLNWLRPSAAAAGPTHTNP